MAKVRKWKSWIGNLDGTREGLVIAGSKTVAASIARVSLYDFNNYWVEDDSVAIIRFQPLTLYIRPLNRSITAWQVER